MPAREGGLGLPLCPADAWLSSEASSLLLIVYLPFHLGGCLKERRRKEKGSKRTFVITRLFEAVANEAPGPFAPGAHGAWPCPAAAGPGAAVICGHQNPGPYCPGSRPRLGGGGVKSFPGPCPGCTLGAAGTAKDATVMGGMGDFLNPGKRGAGSPALPSLWPLGQPPWAPFPRNK